MTAWSIAGQAIVVLIIGYGIFQIAVGLVGIAKTALFRMRLKKTLRACAEDWPKGYNEWKARQAA